MSRIKTQSPIIHTPSFKTYRIAGFALKKTLDDLGIDMPMFMLDSWYYYTDAEGWSKLLPDLMVKSNLWSEDKFDCDDMAWKAKMTCVERYELNTMAFVIGYLSTGRHSFNLIYDGDEWLTFEPSDGFGLAGQAFPIGAEGYKPELILV
uniref:Agglutinin C-terminal domain-containing protein n=1 Tax=viral metagenome TaxID=1070528 RepID=A0A6M3LCA0_9ZZZZ